MDYLTILKASNDSGLQANPVPVPELAAHFPKGASHVFWIVSLSAHDKDQLDEAYRTYLARNEANDKDSRELYRSFVVAYCLGDSQNNRSAVDEKTLHQLVAFIANSGNRVVSRLFNVCNGANRIYGVDEELKKTSSDQSQTTKSADGNGESPSPSDTLPGPLGSVASPQPNTQSSASSPKSKRSV